MKNFSRVIPLSFVLLLSTFTHGQNVGEKVWLESSNPHGVPVHRTAGDSSYIRWANESIAKVLAADSSGRWVKISSEGKEGWVAKNYVKIIEDLDQQAESTQAESPCYVIGTWNLEWFNDVKTRGFPEYNQHGPKYGPRTLEDFSMIAGIIKNQLMARIIALEEINGRPGEASSDELDRLVSCLGTNWAYVITKSGGEQRVAILYDSTAARKDFSAELNIPNTKIQGKGILEREPLIVKFTLLGNEGAAKNDLVVVGIHLASGQELTENHDKAMELLRNALHQEFTQIADLKTEKDVLVMGDFNADRYDNHAEAFWVNYDSDGFSFKTLSPEDDSDYPPTRLAGVPLFPRSKIDYILASGKNGGIEDDLVQLTGQVHTELLPPRIDDFRAHVSDHLPVTVRVQLVADDD